MIGQRFLKYLGQINLPVFVKGLCVNHRVCHQHPSRKFLALTQHSVSICTDLQGQPELRTRAFSFFFKYAYTLHMHATSKSPGYTVTFQSIYGHLFLLNVSISLLFVSSVILSQATMKLKHLLIIVPNKHSLTWGRNAFSTEWAPTSLISETFQETIRQVK